jgi:hypothetical protein
LSDRGFLPMHPRMVSRRSQILRWALVALFVGLFVWYRIADPGMPEPVATAKPRAAVEQRTVPAAQQRQAKALVELAEDGAPLRRQRAGLREYLRDSGVSASSIRTVLEHTKDGLALWPGKDGARTRLGGDPVLPAGAAWPGDPTGLPFRFVGAVDFAELPHMEPLPRAGTLALFWAFNWGEGGGAKMDYVAATRAYFIPPGTPTSSPTAPAATFPVTYKPLRATRVPIAGDPNLVADELEGSADAERVFAAMNEVRGRGIYPHHLLGTPIEVQGPVLAGMPAFFDPKHDNVSAASRERYSAAERKSADEWTLLAQIEGQDDLVIADGGALYFVIPRKDLEARRFDRVIGIMDSH